MAKVNYRRSQAILAIFVTPNCQILSSVRL